VQTYDSNGSFHVNSNTIINRLSFCVLRPISYAVKITLYVEITLVRHEYRYHLRACQNHNARGYYTLRVETTLQRVVITLEIVSENHNLRVKSLFACGNCTLLVEINLERVEITHVRVGITFVPVEITLRVEITLCVLVSHSSV
jgi:hypothetical protein